METDQMWPKGSWSLPYRSPPPAAWMCLSISFASSFALLVEPLENSPRCKTNPTFKDDSRDAGADLASQPEAHEDLVDVRSANPDVATADAFLDEAEGLVQPAGPGVRRKDRELRFIEALGPHPLEDSLHQDAAESNFPPPVPDGEIGRAHV